MICLSSSVVAFRRPSGGAAVECVEVVGTLAGNRFEIVARCFVLACGGIENARLLLCSARAADGLPDPRDLVGRFFMEHAHFNLGQLALGHDWDPRLYLNGTPVPGAQGMEVNSHLGLRQDVEVAEQIAAVAVQVRPRLPSHGEKSLQRIIGALKQGRYPDDLGHHLQ